MLERRLAVVLYADAVGYSSETRSDELGTHKALTKRFGLLEGVFARNGGRVIYNPGDAVLAEFDSINGAVSAAVEAQEALRVANAAESLRLDFRVGINLGDIIVDRSNIYGDGVNITERIQRIASPGGICISEAVFAALGKPSQRLFSFCGEHILKNIEGPMRVYRFGSDTPPLLSPAVDEQVFVTVCALRARKFDKLAATLDPERSRSLMMGVSHILATVVARHGGVVVAEFPDRYIAVFGVEPGHEKAALSAVRASFEFRAGVATIAADLPDVRDWAMGIDCGLAIVEAAGANSVKVFGSAMTRASALASGATSPGVFVTPDMAEAIADSYECVSIETRGIDGLLLRVLGPRSGSPGRQCELVGRRAELLQLQGLIEVVITTGRGCVAQVTGEAGIGKTRLVEELAASVPAPGACLRIEIDRTSGIAGQQVAGAILPTLLGLQSETAEELQRQLKKAVATGLLTSDQLPFVFDALDVPLPEDLRGQYSLLDDQARKFGKRQVTLQIVSAVARQRPLIIIAEDIQLADHAERAILTGLAEIASTLPILLVVTARTPTPERGGLHRLGSATLFSIHLGPLSQEECLRIARHFGFHDDAFIADCVARAAGNPLFFVQLLRHASRGETIPATILDVIKSRLGNLPKLDRAALQCAAVAGARVSTEILRSMLGVRDYYPRDLADSELLFGVGDEWTFSHALIRDAVYQSMTASRRRDLHRRTGELLGDRELISKAEHFGLAEDPRAANAFCRAGNDQMGRFRYAEALELAERGLACCGADDSFSLLLLKSKILFSTGLVASAIAVLRQAVDAAQDELHRTNAWLLLAKCETTLDRYEDALRYLGLAEASAHRSGQKKEFAQVCYLRGNVYFPLGRVDDCYNEHNKALDIARATGCFETEASALSGLGDAEYARGRMLSAHQRYLECVEIAKKNAWLRIAAENHHMVASAAHYFLPLPQARREGFAALELASRIAHQRAELCCYSFLSVIAFDLGEWDLVESSVASCQALAEQLGAQRFSALNFTLLAKICRLKEDRGTAHAHIQRALAQSRGAGMSYNGARVLSEFALIHDNPDASRDALKEGEALLAAGCIGSNHLWFYRDAIDVAIALGDADAARDYARKLASYIASEPLVWADIFVRRGLMLAESLDRPASKSNPQAGDLIHLASRFGYERVVQEIAQRFPDALSMTAENGERRRLRLVQG